MTRHPPPVPAAGAVVVDRGRLLLVERGAGPLQGTWAVPGGRQEPGETLRETARRETLEETGIEVVVGEPFWVGDLVDSSNDPQWHFTVVDFLALPIGGTLRAAGDARRAEWVPLEEAGQRVVTESMLSLVETLARHRS